MRVRAHAPGRVNLIGDHTDYTGGLALAMAIDLGTTVEAVRRGERIALRSDQDPAPADMAIDVGRDDVSAISPAWARLVAGVVAEVRPAVGLVGTVTSTVPIGSGLSSSAALELAVALALGFEGTVLDLAQLGQRAEHAATGVPSGLLDQLTSAAGVDGAALLIDHTSMTVEPVGLPEADVAAVDSGQARTLAGTAYAERRAQCEAAEREIGPLRDATESDVAGLVDPVLRRRARHVVTENERVCSFATALAAHDLAGAGVLMAASHASLRDDFEVSTAVVDELVATITAIPGVHGVRITGGGFGGSVVVVAEPGTPLPGRRLRAVGGATVEVVDDVPADGDPAGR